jgi:hypothetical protein
MVDHHGESEMTQQHPKFYVSFKKMEVMRMVHYNVRIARKL